MSEELGNYESSFFIMNVPTEADIDIRNMPDADFAVFFHEYIHFLQDITSFYGYNAIFSHGEYIRKVITDIYKGPKQISFPFHLIDGKDNVWLNKRITTQSLGDKSEQEIFFIKKAYIQYYKLNDVISLPELQVDVVTDRGSDTITVGAYSIRENMAYLMERQCTTKYKTSKSFPYQIVELLADKICPGKLNCLDLIALCDIALQCSVPGHGLYLFLKAIGKGDLVVNRPEDIYDFFFSKRTKFLGVDESVPQALITAAYMAMDHLLSYVRVESLNDGFQQWILFTISAGVELRLLHPYFFLEMARGGRDKKNAVLQIIANYIGSPQIINKLGKRFQLATNRPICKFEYLEAVKEIEALFEYGVKQCSLRPWCEMSPDGAPVDERCNQSPWERCNDNQLCPYGLLWRHWQLEDYEVSFEN